MRLSDLVETRYIEAGAVLSDKDAALRRVAALACAHPALAQVSEAELLAALRAREDLASTGVGGGLAIPHCRLRGLEQFVVGLVGVPDGVDFDALDAVPVRLLVFIIAPEDAPNRHIRLLSEVSRVFSDASVVAELAGCAAPAGMQAALVRRAAGDEAAGAELVDEAGSRRLFLVYVRDDPLFDRILQVLTGLSPGSVAVLEAKSAGEYLARIPLFAGLWSDHTPSVCRLVTALVDTGLTNEAIRRIEQVTGRLSASSDVLLTVQDVFYSSGSLGT